MDLRIFGNRLPKFVKLLVTGLVLLGIGGCNQPSTDKQALVDALGRTVAIPDSVHSISSIAPSVTEVIFAAHADDKLISVTTADNFPPSVDDIPKLSAFPLDIERLVALDPDVVFASDQVNRTDESDRLGELNIPVYFLPSKTLDDVFSSIEVVADVTHSEEGKLQASLLRGAVDMIAGQVETAGRSNSTVLVLIDYQELYGFGRGSYVNDLVSLAGGRSITADLDVSNPVLSDEFVLREDPDIIIGTFGAEFETKQLTNLRPTWAALSAVRNDRVYSIEGDILLRPGPRAVDALAIMTNWITPRAFRDNVR